MKIIKITDTETKKEKSIVFRDVDYDTLLNFLEVIFFNSQEVDLNKRKEDNNSSPDKSNANKRGKHE